MYDIDQELFNECLDVSDILFNQIWKKCSEHERYTFPCGYSTSKDYVRVDLNFRPRVMKESSVNPLRNALFIAKVMLRHIFLLGSRVFSVE